MDLNGSQTWTTGQKSGNDKHELPRELPVLQKLKQDLKNDLIAGLLVIIPLATTIWLTITIASWVIRLLTRFPKQLNPFTGMHPLLTDFINLSIGLAVPLAVILVMGLMARNIAGRWLLDLGERTLQAIPLAGAIYKTLQQLLQTLLQDSKNRFRRVILIEYPRRGLWAVAFVTGSVTAAPAANQMLSVFIPTTPNPTTGWYAVVPESDVINLSISIEDAFKVLLSGGIVGPDLAAAVPPERTLRGLEEGRQPSTLPPNQPLADRNRQLSMLPLEED